MSNLTAREALVSSLARQLGQAADDGDFRDCAVNMRLTYGDEVYNEAFEIFEN